MSPGEIIDVLKHWPEWPDGVAYLVAGFRPDGCETIRHDGPDALRKLKGMLVRGASPIGFIGLSRQGDETGIRIAPIADYDEDTKASCMAVLSTFVGELVREVGGVPLES
jgi:hypothetical protein